MLKRSLFASIALINLSSIQAATTGTQGDSNCHCPCGSAQGWVLIPAGPGMPCPQGAGSGVGTDTATGTGTGHTAAGHTGTEHTHPHHSHHHTAPAAGIMPEQQAPQPAGTPLPNKPAIQSPAHTSPKPSPEELELKKHPLPTTEQQQLNDELADPNIKPQIFSRPNPNILDKSGKPVIQGEWGKVRPKDGKVYFIHLGNWSMDPNVKPTDIVERELGKSVKERAREIDEANKKAQKPGENPAAGPTGISKPPATGAETTAGATAVSPAAPPPPANTSVGAKERTGAGASAAKPTSAASSGYQGRRYEVKLPDKLATEGRELQRGPGVYGTSQGDVNINMRNQLPEKRPELKIDVPAKTPENPNQQPITVR